MENIKDKEIIEQDISNKSERNYGIDLLRFISMFFVVILHSLGQGGILANLHINTVQYKVCWFLEIFAYCAVDIFALITGYVSYSNKEKKYNYYNYIQLWLKVVFWGVLINIFFDMFNSDLVSKKDYLVVIFPVTNKLYWYFTAYTCLYFLIPFLNAGVRTLNIWEIKKLSVVLFFGLIMINFLSDAFVFNYGYSFVWIMLLYIIGAIIKKFNIEKYMDKKRCLFGIFLLYFITYIYKIYGYEGDIMNIHFYKDMLIQYTSPTILLISIFYLIFFSKIKFNKFFNNMIKLISSATFTIYILNNHRLIWDYLIKDAFVKYIDLPAFFIVIKVLVFSLLFSIVAILMGKVQELLFNKLKIKQICIKTSEIIENIVEKVICFMIKKFKIM